jgi:DNA-binding protein HU-beta
MSVRKEDVVRMVADATKTNLKTTRAVMEGVLACIKKCVAQGDKVTICGFAAFSQGKIAARQGRNPQTGELMEFPARNTVHIRPSRMWKEEVNR